MKRPLLILVSNTIINVDNVLYIEPNDANTAIVHMVGNVDKIVSLGELNKRLKSSYLPTVPTSEEWPELPDDASEWGLGTTGPKVPEGTEEARPLDKGPEDFAKRACEGESVDEQRLMEGYVPRKIDEYEYEKVCEASQHFSESFEEYCARIHKQEYEEELNLRKNPEYYAIVSAVGEGVDGETHLIYFKVLCHYYGGNQCTEQYVESKMDAQSIAVLGEDNFHKIVDKYDGNNKVNCM